MTTPITQNGPDAGNMPDAKLRKLAGDAVADAVLRGLNSGRASFDKFRNDVHFNNATMWMVTLLKVDAVSASDLHECVELAEAIFEEYQNDIASEPA